MQPGTKLLKYSACAIGTVLAVLVGDVQAQQVPIPQKFPSMKFCRGGLRPFSSPIWGDARGWMISTATRVGAIAA